MNVDRGYDMPLAYNYPTGETYVASDTQLPDFYDAEKDAGNWWYQDISADSTFLQQHFGCDETGRYVAAPDSSEGLARTALFLHVRHEIEQGTLVAKVGQHHTNRRARPRVIFEAPRIDYRPDDPATPIPAETITLEPADNELQSSVYDYIQPLEALAGLAVTHAFKWPAGWQRSFEPDDRAKIPGLATVETLDHTPDYHTRFKKPYEAYTPKHGPEAAPQPARQRQVVRGITAVIDRTLHDTTQTWEIY